MAEVQRVRLSCCRLSYLVCAMFPLQLTSLFATTLTLLFVFRGFHWVAAESLVPQLSRQQYAMGNGLAVKRFERQNPSKPFERGHQAAGPWLASKASLYRQANFKQSAQRMETTKYAASTPGMTPKAATIPMLQSAEICVSSVLP